jgi:ribosomal protein S18 acetylase RimI-like enzyme
MVHLTPNESLSGYAGACRYSLGDRTGQILMSDHDRLEAHALEIRIYCEEDEADVTDLWKRCGLLRPWNDPAKDIRRKRGVNPEWFLVAVLGQRIIGTIMIGYEGHRGWINYLAVDPVQQRLGIGRRLMHRAEEILKQAGCPKVNLQVRADNKVAAEFYRSLGYTSDDVISFGKRLRSN